MLFYVRFLIFKLMKEIKGGKGGEIYLGICPLGEFSTCLKDSFLTREVEETKLLFLDLM